MNKSFKKKTVVVGMSGGVDSSVTAALLKYGRFSAGGGPASGWDVIGVFMKNWSDDNGDYGCTWVEDSEDARKVAQVLDIPFYIWNFEKEYYDHVVKYFLHEYKEGRTPNPDVMCNKEIKFKVFLQKALSLGADYVATGHYARIRTNYNLQPKTYNLLKGVDPTKDQSYFLYTLKQEQLSRILFPIGNYKKSQIRILAQKFKLPNAAKKDSQGICFMGKVNITEFLKQHIKARAGAVVTTTGQVLGIHSGLPFYTIGQREGMGIGGNGPYYVVNKDFKANKLIVTNDVKDKQLWKKEFIVNDVSWIGNEPKFPLKTGVTIRYHHPPFNALIRQAKIKHYDTTLYRSGSLRIRFQEPQRAITVGQAAVIYNGNELLGGGIIDSVQD